MNEAAIITGGADRLGKSIALSLAKMGYDIALHYNRSREQAERTAMEIREMGVECHLFQSDFQDLKEVSSLIRAISEKLNPTVLINSASEFTKSTIFDPGYELMDRLFRVNFMVPYLLTKELVANAERGVIINLLDTKISQYNTEHFDYLISKMALEKFTRMAALQLAPTFRVNGIAPGLILPPKDRDTDYLENLSKGIPMQGIGSQKNITETVSYLVSNSFVTGEVIYIDGGEHLGAKKTISQG